MSVPLPGSGRRRQGAAPAPTALAAALVLLPFLACDSTAPEPVLEIEVEGRRERGLAVTLGASLDGRGLDPEILAWTVEPEGAAEVEGRTLRLLEAGPLTLSAFHSDAGASADTVLEILRPPDVVFDAVADGNRDVYRAAIDGRELVRLTTDPGEDADPSAAAGTVVFRSWRDGNADLRSVPVDGGSTALLSHLATGAEEREPALARDGGRVAFVRSEAGAPRIFTADVSGGGAAPATEGTDAAGGLEASPAWAPDGARLALMSTAASDADLYAVDTAEGTASVLAGGDGPQVEPAWSPDGVWLAYVGVEPPNSDADVLLLGVETGDLLRMTSRPGAEGQPAFLPDGRIVYTVFTAEGTELWWLDPEGGAESHPIPLELERPEHPAGVFP